jgi:hypothetical protein
MSAPTVSDMAGIQQGAARCPEGIIIGTPKFHPSAMQPSHRGLGGPLPSLPSLQLSSPLCDEDTSVGFWKVRTVQFELLTASRHECHLYKKLN